MPPVPPKTKTTPEQRFRYLFDLSEDESAPQGERDNAKRKVDAWLKRYGKTRRDISSILAQAERDNEAAKPPPPPSDPRDDSPHPFEDPRFTPAGLVEGIVAKYVTMSEQDRII